MLRSGHRPLRRDRIKRVVRAALVRGLFDGRDGTQQRLAEYFGVSRQYISLIVRQEKSDLMMQTADYEVEPIVDGDDTSGVDS